VITKGDMRWVNSPLATKGLKERVGALRCGLDVALWDEAESTKRCNNASTIFCCALEDVCQWMLHRNGRTSARAALGPDIGRSLPANLRFVRSR
jgi:hypothetical protein